MTWQETLPPYQQPETALLPEFEILQGWVTVVLHFEMVGARALNDLVCSPD